MRLGALEYEEGPKWEFEVSIEFCHPEVSSPIRVMARSNEEATMRTWTLLLAVATALLFSVEVYSALTPHPDGNHGCAYAAAIAIPPRLASESMEARVLIERKELLTGPESALAPESSGSSGTRIVGNDTATPYQRSRHRVESDEQPETGGLAKQVAELANGWLSGFAGAAGNSAGLTALNQAASPDFRSGELVGELAALKRFLNGQPDSWPNIATSSGMAKFSSLLRPPTSLDLPAFSKAAESEGVNRGAFLTFRLLGNIYGSTREKFSTDWKSAPPFAKWLMEKIRAGQSVATQDCLRQCPEVPFGFSELFVLACSSKLGTQWLEENDDIAAILKLRTDGLGRLVSALRSTTTLAELQKSVSFGSSKLAATLATWFHKDTEAAAAQSRCHPILFPLHRDSLPSMIAGDILRSYTYSAGTWVNSWTGVIAEDEVQRQSRSASAWSFVAGHLLPRIQNPSVNYLNGVLVLSNMGGGAVIPSIGPEWSEASTGVTLPIGDVSAARAFWTAVAYARARQAAGSGSVSKQALTGPLRKHESFLADAVAALDRGERAWTRARELASNDSSASVTFILTEALGSVTDDQNDIVNALLELRRQRAEDGSGQVELSPNQCFLIALACGVRADLDRETKSELESFVLQYCSFQDKEMLWEFGEMIGRTA